jgi:hypothetical protein
MGRGGRVLVVNLKKIDHLEEPGADGRIILRWIFRKWYVMAWTGSIWLRIGRGDRHL